MLHTARTKARNKDTQLLFKKYFIKENKYNEALDWNKNYNI